MPGAPKLFVGCLGQHAKAQTVALALNYVKYQVLQAVKPHPGGLLVLQTRKLGCSYGMCKRQAVQRCVLDAIRESQHCAEHSLTQASSS